MYVCTSLKIVDSFVTITLFESLFICTKVGDKNNVEANGADNQNRLSFLSIHTFFLN